MMKLNELMVDDGDFIYYHPQMRNVFEDNMDYLRNHSSTRLQVVSEGLAYTFQNDLQGLFTALKIPSQLHYVVMRMNYFTTFTSSVTDTLTLLIPNADEVSQIVQSNNATNRIT